jgi:hypothetical protein
MNEHKKKMLLRYLQHWETLSQKQAIHMLRKMLCDNRSNDAKESIKQTIIEQNAIVTQMEYNTA